MDDKRTLCGRCVSDYRTAGYYVSYAVNEKRRPCDICERQGREVIVIRQPRREFAETRKERE